MKRLVYILFLLIAAFNLAAQKNYVIDSVCVGASRSYQINGEKGSTYEWYIKDTLGNVLSNPTYIDFWKVKSPGDTIWASKIKVPWNDIGEFDILTLHFSSHGCDTLEQGRVKVFPAPEGDAGEDIIVCVSDTVDLSTATAANYSTIMWTTTGDGSFKDITKVNPKYIPGTNDSKNGKVFLVLSVHGLAENITCTPVADTVEILFGNPVLSFTSSDLLCYNDSSGKAKVNINGGIAPYDISWVGPGKFVSAAESIYNLISGKYTVTVTDNFGCVVSDFVEIHEPEKLATLITADKDIICEGETLLINGQITGGTLDYTYNWNGNGPVFISADNYVVPTFNYTSAGLYELVFSVTDANGCFDADTLEVIVNPMLTDTLQQTICENQLPYNWQGEVFTSADTVIQNIVSTTTGCDTVRVLQLQVNPNITDTLQQTICEIQLPYNWQGEVFTSADTIIQNIVSTTTGCDTVRVLQLQVNPNLTDTLQQTICENQLPFNWQGVLFTSADTIVQNIASKTLGCDTIRVLQLEVSPLLKDTMQYTICENLLPFKWFGQTFTSSDTIIVNIPSVTGCDTLRTLELQSVPEILTTLDTAICLGDLPFNWRGKDYSVTGNYTETVISASECDSIFFLNLIVLPEIEILVDTTICETKIPFVWNGKDYFATGIYHDKIEGVIGCDTLLTLNLEILPEIKYTLDTIICALAMPFNWYGKEYPAAGIYHDTLTSLAGCDTILALNLKVEPELAVSISITADETEVEEGETVTFTSTAINEGTAPVYAWFVNGKEVAGEVSVTFSYIPQNSDTVYAVLTSDFMCTLGNPAISNKIPIKVNVILPVSVTIGADEVNICEGTSVTFTATPVNGGTNPVYAWFVNGLEVTGVTSDSYTYLPLDGDVIRAVLTSSLTNVSGNPATSNEISISIRNDQPVSINIFADKTEVCDGDAVNFTSAPVNGGSNPVYAWFVNSTLIPGETSRTFTFTPKNNDLVYAMLTSSLSCAFGNPATSNIVPIKVNDNTIISVTIDADKTDICESEPVTFTANPANGGPNPRYAWFVNGKEITGETSGTFTYFPADKDAVYAILTSDLMCTADDNAYSNKITINVRKGLQVAVSINSDKKEICEGELVTYTATPENGGTNPVYAWYVNGTVVAGETSAIFKYPPQKNDWIFATLISDVECPLGNPAKSDTLIVDVTEKLPVAVTVAPDKNFICIDDLIIFKATPENGGTNPVYSWFVNNIQVVGVIADVYSYNPADGDVVHVVMTSDLECVAENPAVSNKVTVSVISEVPVSVSILPDRNTICEGETVIYTATPVNGGSNPVYAWFVNGSEIKGENKQTFTYAPEKDDEVYTVMTSAFDCVTGNPATSNKVIVKINEKIPVGITIVSDKTEVCPGEMVTFKATSENGGSNPVYKWFVNGLEIAGETDIIFNYKPNNGDEIFATLLSDLSCAANNPATSNKIGISVISELQAAVSVVSDKTEICDGETVNFKAIPVNGGSNPAYTWFVNGLKISGETSATYSYKPENNDVVHVVMESDISCATGSPATSNKITILVSDKLIVKIEIKTDAELVCKGQPVTFTSESENGGSAPVYSWFVNKVKISGENSVSFTYLPNNGDEIFASLESDLVCLIQKSDTSNVIKINVGDTLAPEAICRNITVYLDVDGKASITASQVDHGSNDNCDLDTLLISKYNFECSDVGKNTVTLTAIDGVGLKDFCTSTVTVLDTIKPKVICRGPFEIQLDENAEYKLTVVEVEEDAVDACGVDTVYVYPHELDCNHIGLTTIALWAVGVNGDSAYCETQVMIYGNRAPNVMDDTVSTDENVPVVIDAVLNDFDEKTSIDISTLSISIKPLHGTVSINKVNGDLTYTPNQNFSGVDVLEYRICDDGIPCEPECGKAFVFITVKPVNDQAVAGDDYYEAGCFSVTRNVMDNDYDIDSDNLTINTNPLYPPNHGELIIDPDGTIYYFPNEGFIGIDSFEYVICDNGVPSLCDTAKVYINVDCSEETHDPLDCELFIPEGFSPNEDGIHDFFRIMCIHNYPNAKLMIFNRNGNLLWEKENYGNYEVWGDQFNAWWWGTSVLSQKDVGVKMINGDPRLKIGSYVYVLQLGNGDIKNGTVLVQY